MLQPSLMMSGWKKKKACPLHLGEAGWGLSSGHKRPSAAGYHWALLLQWTLLKDPNRAGLALPAAPGDLSYLPETHRYTCVFTEKCVHRAASPGTVASSVSERTKSAKGPASWNLEACLYDTTVSMLSVAHRGAKRVIPLSLLGC